MDSSLTHIKLTFGKLIMCVYDDDLYDAPMCDDVLTYRLKYQLTNLRSENCDTRWIDSRSK